MDRLESLPSASTSCVANGAHKALGKESLPCSSSSVSSLSSSSGSSASQRAAPVSACIERQCRQARDREEKEEEEEEDSLLEDGELEEIVDEIFLLTEPPLMSLHALAVPPRVCSQILKLLQVYHRLEHAEEDFPVEEEERGQREGRAELCNRNGEAVPREQAHQDLNQEDDSVTKESKKKQKEREEEQRKKKREGGCVGTGREQSGQRAQKAQQRTGEEWEGRATGLGVYVPRWKRRGRRVDLFFLKRCFKPRGRQGGGGMVYLLLGLHPKVAPHTDTLRAPTDTYTCCCICTLSTRCSLRQATRRIFRTVR